MCITLYTCVFESRCTQNCKANRDSPPLFTLRLLYLPFVGATIGMTVISFVILSYPVSFVALHMYSPPSKGCVTVRVKIPFLCLHFTLSMITFVGCVLNRLTYNVTLTSDFAREQSIWTEWP